MLLPGHGEPAVCAESTAAAVFRTCKQGRRWTAPLGSYPWGADVPGEHHRARGGQRQRPAGTVLAVGHTGRTAGTAARF